MTESQGLFSFEEARPPAAAEPVPPMTDEQRAEIRALFSQLRIPTAREQFHLVDVLIGKRLHSVADLDKKHAAALIPRLRARVTSRSKTSSGDSWTDREEDTWIDHL